MGCQVLYVQQVDEVNTGSIWDHQDDGGLRERSTHIYLTT
jgi:hypothetical protein